MQCALVNAPFVAATAAAAAGGVQRRQRLVVSAGQGFANKPQKAAGSSGSKKQPKLARYLGEETAGAQQQQGAAGPGDGWVEMPGVDAETTFLSKPIKPLILATGRAVCLFKVGERIYATDASSTAYQYPMHDSTILSVKGKPAVEVALDGTTYDLETGKVLSWCPKNTITRRLLGSLKDKVEPVPLPVYPVEVQKDGKIFVKFV